MDWLINILGSAEFWMGLSLIASALPGPQTRVFPMLFKAVSRGLSAAGKTGTDGDGR
ncbi:MAG: hypothetical protein IID61_04055 [SAR324 cluster bacterium]|nr:hypothetical protein [SAR324 cluster bacterium]